MTNNQEIKPMLTTSDVARLLNVHINTVRRWSNQGILKSYRIGSRDDRRFERNDVIEFLSASPNLNGTDIGAVPGNHQSPANGGNGNLPH
jgi:excisionase family DNA binding protein